LKVLFEERRTILSESDATVDYFEKRETRYHHLLSDASTSSHLEVDIKKLQEKKNTWSLVRQFLCHIFSPSSFIILIVILILKEEGYPKRRTSVTSLLVS
jgi:hypothetical protein